jgi:hypothetical protein
MTKRGSAPDAEVGKLASIGFLADRSPGAEDRNDRGIESSRAMRSGVVDFRPALSRRLAIESIALAPLMASLEEYFSGDFASTLGTHWDWTISPRVGSAGPVTVIARAHWDSSAHTRFVSYFVPAEASGADWALTFLVQSAPRVLQEAESKVNVFTSHPVFDPEGTSFKDAPFSGRVFLSIHRRSGIGRMFKVPVEGCHPKRGRASDSRPGLRRASE